MARLVSIVLALPFLLGGFYMLLSAALNGGFVLGAMGLFSMGVSARHIFRTLWPKQPPDPTAHAPLTAAALKQLQRPETSTGYRHAEPEKAVTALAFYGPVLPISPIEASAPARGGTLAWRIQHTPEKDVAVRTIFSILWSVFGVVGITATIAARQTVGVLFSLAFASAGGFVWFPMLRRALALRRLPRVEISAEPVFLGDEFEVLVRCRPSERITHLKVDVECREIVEYTEGTTTRTETNRVWAQKLLHVEGADAAREHRVRARLDVFAPHSFRSAHNTIAWSVRVRADLPAWPDYDEHLVFRALPRPTT